MKVLDLAKGRTMKVMTDLKVPVLMTIKEIIPQSHSRDLEPATAANDWWPASESWNTFEVKFTNGTSKTYDSLDKIEIEP